jgi:hypothetical protein
VCTSSKVIEHEESQVNQRTHNPEAIEEKACKEIEGSKNFSSGIGKLR